MATIRRREQTVAEMEWKLVDEGWSTRVERQTTEEDVKNVVGRKVGSIKWSEN